MTPPSIPKVCRECKLYIAYSQSWFTIGCDATIPCAALELLKTISAPDPEECIEECPLEERLRKEVE